MNAQAPIPKKWTACFPSRRGKRYFPHVHIGHVVRCADHWADYITINEAGTANVGGMEPFDQIAKMIAAAPVMLSALQEFAAGRGRIKTARAIVAKLERKK